MKTKILISCIVLFICSCQKNDTIFSESNFEETATPFSAVFTSKGKKLKAELETKGYEIGPRNSHTSVVFKNKIWILGGQSKGKSTNDIIHSKDGKSWEKIKSFKKFPRRYGHASVVFNNRIWVFGGRNEQGPINDIWSSHNGITWVKESKNPAFQPRWNLTVTEFKGALWLMGGSTTAEFQSPAICCGFKDLWKSTNGQSWEKIFDESLGPNMLSGHESVEFKNHLMVVGGNVFGDAGSVNFSANGEDWVNFDVHPEFKDHGLVSSGNYLWATAGVQKTVSGFNVQPSNDIWYSIDSQDWFKASPSKQFESRKRHTSVIFHNKLWIINGVDASGKDLSDVWSFSNSEFNQTIGGFKL